ncbi:hypothetical protein [Enterobacter roggenkampii]|uniref:hypothetical protein n=1 Tax=Enterobacter roggenkampii TaxID=1812935 RepID=UPI001C7015E9|nr:hypothetical protein [Enterobacter roggenkampii]MBW9467653.1 hypothetical protein [Enterobacter roggenkampii]
MAAMIKIKDEQGNEYTLDNLTDSELFRIFNITKVSSKVGINKFTLAARVCRQLPDGPYRSLVTALAMGKP